MYFIHFLLMLSFLQASEPVYIGLGETCNVGSALEKYELRKKAFPFDWNITPFNSLYLLIENDFVDFLRADNLVLREDLSTVIDTFYGIEFAHDFPIIHEPVTLENDESLALGPICSNFLDYLPEVKKKYQRRIERFYQFLTSDSEVIFIRHNHSHINRDQIKDFYCLIKRKFPNLNFKLIIWGYTSDLQEKWEFPNLKSFYFIYGTDLNLIYKDIFESLGIIH